MKVIIVRSTTIMGIHTILFLQETTSQQFIWFQRRHLWHGISQLECLQQWFKKKHWRVPSFPLWKSQILKHIVFQNWA